MYAPGSLGFPPLLRARRGIMYTAKGSDVCPGVLRCPPLLHARLGMNIAKGLDICPGCP